MARKRRKGDARPKSSAELIREANEDIRGTGPDRSRASDTQLEESGDWLEADGPESSEGPSSMPRADTATATGAGRESRFETPPDSPRSVPRSDRATAAPPTGPIGATGDARRMIGLILAILVAAGVAFVGVAVFAVSEDTGPVIATSAGFIASASDPCSDATISGDLEAVITYWPDSETPKIQFQVIGRQLVGSDGSTYVLELTATTTGTPGQQVFEFGSDRMVTTRSDGVAITDSAIITIEIVDGLPDDWSYESTGGACPG